jgi:hypothetical protein
MRTAIVSGLEVSCLSNPGSLFPAGYMVIRAPTILEVESRNRFLQMYTEFSSSLTFKVLYLNKPLRHAA